MKTDSVKGRKTKVRFWKENGEREKGRDKCGKKETARTEGREESRKSERRWRGSGGAERNGGTEEKGEICEGISLKRPQSFLCLFKVFESVLPSDLMVPTGGIFAGLCTVRNFIRMIDEKNRATIVSTNKRNSVSAEFSRRVFRRFSAASGFCFRTNWRLAKYFFFNL